MCLNRQHIHVICTFACKDVHALNEQQYLGTYIFLCLSSGIRLKTSRIYGICTSFCVTEGARRRYLLSYSLKTAKLRRGKGKKKKERKKIQQAETLKMSYYVWSLNPLSPANTFLWLVSKSDKACVCSQLIDRTVLIKQYPSLGKKAHNLILLSQVFIAQRCFSWMNSFSWN